MGYIRHHAIVVTGTYGKWVERARREAVRLATFRGIGGHGADLIGPIIGPTVNGTETFLIAPDGSKEGWDASDQGDAFRADFIAWLEAQRYEDGSSPLSWVLVQYGDDELDTKVLADSDEYRRDMEPEP